MFSDTSTSNKRPREEGEEPFEEEPPMKRVKADEEELKEGEELQQDLAAADIFDGLNVSTESNTAQVMQEHCKRILDSQFYKEASSQLM